MGQAAEDLEPRVNVACLGAYKSGVLHGVWIDVENDAEAVQEAIVEMLEASPPWAPVQAVPLCVWAMRRYRGILITISMHVALLRESEQSPEGREPK